MPGLITLLRSFEFLRDYDLAGRLSQSSECQRSPLPYVPRVAELRAQEEERLNEFAREHFPDLHAIRLWKMAIPRPSFTVLRCATV